MRLLWFWLKSCVLFERLALQAFVALHAKKPFFVGSECFETVANYVQLRIRQMAGKLRDVVSSNSKWEVLHSKLTREQESMFVRLRRCIAPDFMTTTSRPQPTPVRAERPPPDRSGSADLLALVPVHSSPAEDDSVVPCDYTSDASFDNMVPELQYVQQHILRFDVHYLLFFTISPFLQFVG